MNIDAQLLKAAQTSVTLAHFNPGTLTLNFSSNVFGPNEIRRVGNAEDSLEMVPPPLLVHEISHSLYVTGTPSGLRQFAMSHGIMEMSAVLINESAASNNGTIEPGIAMKPTRNNDTKMLAQHRRALISGHLGHQSLLGGSTVDISEVLDTFFSQSVNVPAVIYLIIKEGAPPLYFYNLDRAQGTAMLLGEMHIAEGLATAIEVARWETSGSDGSGRERAGQAPNPPADPYLNLLRLYDAKVGRVTRCPDPLYEFIAVADTALLMDTHILDPTIGSDEFISPVANFFRLLGVLEDANGAFSLTDVSVSGIANFQSTLLARAGAMSRDLREITDGVKKSAASWIENDPFFHTFPDALREKWISAFNWTCDMRLHKYYGAHPYNALIHAPIPVLRTFCQEVSTAMLNGATQTERQHFPADNSGMFDVFVVEHLSPVLKELSFSGREPCQFRERGCILPPRPACDGVTHSLSSFAQQCGREAALGVAMTSFGIKAIKSHDAPKG